MEREVYTLADLKGALEHQGTTLKPGTILLIRTGWMETYEASTPEQKQRLSSIENIKSAGIQAAREMIAWLWDQRIAAIGTDCPAVEPLPFDFTSADILHYRALPLLGLRIHGGVGAHGFGRRNRDTAQRGRHQVGRRVSSFPSNLKRDARGIRSSSFKLDIMARCGSARKGPLQDARNPECPLDDEGFFPERKSRLSASNLRNLFISQ
jgi:hypothetical protein